MPPITRRRRLLIAVPVAVLFVVAVAALLLAPGQDLRTHSAQIAVGMSREQVEGILGPPAVVLPRPPGKGTVLSWTDQFWQIDVRTGPDGRVESVGYVPSDSLYRRTVGRLTSFPN